MTDRLRVLVTAIGGAGHGEQILKALCLAPRPYFIVGADARPDCAQFSLVDEAVTVPLASDPCYIEAVLRLCERFAIRAVFHGCEPELRRMSAARDQFAARGIFLPINPPHVIDVCMNKVETSRRLAECGFDVPRVVVVERAADLARVDFFPVVVKPAVGSGGSANVFIAQARDELEHLATYLRLDEGADFLIQEYVGTPDQEYTVGVLHGMDGTYLNAIAVRRELATQLNVRAWVPNRTGRAELGPRLVVSSGISQGEVGRFPHVTEECAAIARALGARGPINIQCRLVDGRVRVFEVNPRFSGTTSIRAMAGYNEPDVLLRREILGEPITPDFPYREGVVRRGLVETWIRDRAAADSPVLQ